MEPNAEDGLEQLRDLSQSNHRKDDHKQSFDPDPYSDGRRYRDGDHHHQSSLLSQDRRLSQVEEDSLICV